MSFSARYNSLRFLNLLKTEKSETFDPQMSSISNFVKLPSTDISDMGLPHIKNSSKFTSFAIAERLDIPLISDIHNPLSFVNPEIGERSVTSGLLVKFNCSNSVNSANGERSEIRLKESHNEFNLPLASPASGERSEISLKANSIDHAFTAYSIPLKSRMPLPLATTPSSVAISSTVTATPGTLPSASVITARRLGSYIET